MTRLQRILIGAYRDLGQWRSTPRLTPPGDRRRIARHNKRCDLADRGIVVCDVAQWLGEPQTRGDRVSNSRIYKELACKNLAHPAAEGRRRQRTVALALTADGIDLARQLIATADTTPAAMLTTATPPVADEVTPREPIADEATPPTDAAELAASTLTTPPTGETLAPIADQATPVEPLAPEATPEATPAAKPLSDEAALLFILTREADSPDAVAVTADFPIKPRHLSRLSYAGLVRIKNHDGALFVETTATGAQTASKFASAQ